MSVAAIVGGQYGSEGKGLVAGHVARDFRHHVRVGAANAGHTVYSQEVRGEYEKHVMQQIPCAAFANPWAALYVGPGAQITPEIFERELRDWATWRLRHGYPPDSVYVDPRAHVITPEHVEVEQRSGLAERIGSTSTIAREGIGAAQAARVMREASCVLAEDHYRDAPVDLPIVITDVPEVLHNADGVLLEGTQGTGLSITTGQFPYATSRNTTAAGLAADAGVAPNRVGRVILVCRTFPIRVAGNSGPFWGDSEEITWDQIGIDPENERTTVTKKVRRVATFSHAQVAYAAKLNGATEIALTFADYLAPEIAGRHGSCLGLDAYPEVQDLIDEIEDATGVPVRYVGTGPHSVIELAGDRLFT